MILESCPSQKCGLTREDVCAVRGWIVETQKEKSCNPWNLYLFYHINLSFFFFFNSRFKIQTLVFIIMAFLEHSHQFVKKNLSNLSYEPKFFNILFIFFILHTHFLKYFTSYYLHSWGEVVMMVLESCPSQKCGFIRENVCARKGVDCRDSKGEVLQSMKSYII